MIYTFAHYQRAGHRIKASEWEAMPKEASSLRITSYTHLYLSKGLYSLSQPSYSYKRALIRTAHWLTGYGTQEAWMAGFLDSYSPIQWDCLITELSISQARWTRLSYCKLVMSKLCSLVSSLSLAYHVSSARCTRSAPYILARFARSESHVSIPSQVSCVAHGTTREHIHFHTLIDVVRSVIARVRLQDDVVVASGDLIS